MSGIPPADDREIAEWSSDAIRRLEEENLGADRASLMVRIVALAARIRLDQMNSRPVLEVDPKSGAARTLRLVTGENVEADRISLSQSFLDGFRRSHYGGEEALRSCSGCGKDIEGQDVSAWWIVAPSLHELTMDRLLCPACHVGSEMGQSRGAIRVDALLLSKVFRVRDMDVEQMAVRDEFTAANFGIIKCHDCGRIPKLGEEGWGVFTMGRIGCPDCVKRAIGEKRKELEGTLPEPMGAAPRFSDPLYDKDTRDMLERQRDFETNPRRTATGTGRCNYCFRTGTFEQRHSLEALWRIELEEHWNPSGTVERRERWACADCAAWIDSVAIQKGAVLEEYLEAVRAMYGNLTFLECGWCASAPIGAGKAGNGEAGKNAPAVAWCRDHFYRAIHALAGLRRRQAA